MAPNATKTIFYELFMIQLMHKISKFIVWVWWPFVNFLVEHTTSMYDSDHVGKEFLGMIQESQITNF